MARNPHYGGPTYRSWCAALTRCRNSKRDDWPLYGGRGIKVCKRWQGKGGFTRFLEDMGIRPAGTTLDRKNTDGDYEPSNCRWATPLQQSQNSRKWNRHGTRNPAAILSAEQVAKIKETWDVLPLSYNGQKKRRGSAYSTIRKLAKEHGVSFGCIAKLVYRQTWD